MKIERDNEEDLAYAYGLLSYYCTICGKKFDSRLVTEGECVQHVMRHRYVMRRKVYNDSSIRTAGGGGVSDVTARYLEVGLCDGCGTEWRSGGVVDSGHWLCWKCQKEIES